MKTKRPARESLRLRWSEPLKQIARNAGHEPEIVLNAVLEGKGDFGFNAATEVYEDLVKAGVIDPAKVVRSALENAASAASMMLTTEAAVAEAPKRPAPMAGCLAAVGWAEEWVAWAEWEAWAVEWGAWTTTATTSSRGARAWRLSNGGGTVPMGTKKAL